ncbi:glycosyltransferase family 2 protein [Polynucleobacter sp. 30F-ANTBAC]|uniref:glycosyltransferase n=1 Tax=Polynucleobacter sp. 30F-ANTBAC TaxID=2689095 RepID=UPI001C0E8340|nr:glycosyltransferase family 2 protein [Polynucleobacter sp. 30F-ANTBAC]MBU3600485.1 glycosyltransferase family 2 protein [Polynucleobacter sp. 30F-ANTBAC]
MYVSVRSKFSSALFIAVMWCSFSIWASRYWFDDLSLLVGQPIAAFLIAFIAIVPGFMNAFMFSSLLFDKRPLRKKLDTYPDLSLLIACYNEEKYILETLDSIERQAYPGNLEVIVIDDGSRDQTSAIVKAFSTDRNWVKLIQLNANQGKAAALNIGLAKATHSKIVTIDADSFLFKDALIRIVERYASDPAHTRAVAGTTLVRNSRDNWLTQSQEWDYFQGIATVKRVQSLNQGTLVAQGCFSIYDKDALNEIGGWPRTVGEDIVLTWALLEKGYRVGYCEDAVIFTIVPNTLMGLVRQRQRWARGMIEAFKHHPKILLKPQLSTFFIWWDLFFPFMDIAFTFGFLPGLVLALVGHYWIVGPMTLSLFPIALLINWLMFRTESKMFMEQGLHVRRNIIGFLIYLLPYNIILQPAAVLGYFVEFLGFKKVWGTK